MARARGWVYIEATRSNSSILHPIFKARTRRFWKRSCEIVVTYRVITKFKRPTLPVDCIILDCLCEVPVNTVTIPSKRKVQEIICDKIHLRSIKLPKMYSDSVIPVKTESFSGMAAKSPLSQCIKSVLRRACVEKRLTVGLLPAIQYLSNNCNGALFCLTAEARPGDSATHMQEVLLQAFCVENGIYVIKVDSEDKMRKLLGCRSSSMDFSCVLVHYPYTDPFSDYQKFDLSILPDAEKDLIDHCENNWGYSQMPVIKLPEK